MSEALGEGGRGFEDARAGLLRRGHLTQHSVDHARCMRLAGGAAHLDALIQNGVRGDAIHVQQLERSHAQRERHRLGQPLVGAREKFADAGVERDLPAQHAHDQRCRKVAVLGGEFCGSRRVEQLIAVAFIFTDHGENLECGRACWGDLRDRLGHRSGGTCGGGACTHCGPLCWLRASA